MAGQEKAEREIWLKQIQNNEGEVSYHVYGATNLTEPSLGSILEKSEVDGLIFRGVVTHITRPYSTDTDPETAQSDSE